MTGRVFVTQCPAFKNAEGGWTEKYDLEDAKRFGELVRLHGAGNVRAVGIVMDGLRRALRDFSDEDFLLPLGDPILIGVATALAAQANRGRVRMLKWDRRSRGYALVTLELPHPRAVPSE